MKQLSLLLILTLVSWASVSAGDALPDDFDQMIERDMQKWQAPGLGLAIVKEGETVLAKGYGIKSFRSNARVNKDTVFQAGSTTKAFASMALAMLVDEGKVSWDDPIIQHIPEFRMGNEYVQNSITIRDALRHSSGVTQLSNINMFLGKSLPTAWKMMESNGQQASFRNNWDYNNTTFALSGRVVERVTGQPFHEFVRNRILAPLGMNNTLMLDEEVRNADNRAEAHQHFEGEDYEIIYPYIEYTQAAGMMNSTPADMTNWMKFLLAKGKWNGDQLVSGALVEEMMSPQILLNPSSIYPAAASYAHNYYSYGLAWFAHDFKGHKVAMHTGSINGMSAIIGLIPEENIGVYVFINSDHIEYRHALMYTVFDLLLGNEAEDWSEKLHAVYYPEQQPGANTQETYPQVAADQLLGTYSLEGSFPLIIEKEGDTLRASLGVNKVELKKQDDNSYLIVDPDTAHIPMRNMLRVNLGDAGNVTGVVFSGLSFQKKS